MKIKYLFILDVLSYCYTIYAFRLTSTLTGKQLGGICNHGSNVRQAIMSSLGSCESVYETNHSFRTKAAFTLACLGMDTPTDEQIEKFLADNLIDLKHNPADPLVEVCKEILACSSSDNCCYVEETDSKQDFYGNAHVARVTHEFGSLLEKLKRIVNG